MQASNKGFFIHFLLSDQNSIQNLSIFMKALLVNCYCLSTTEENQKKKQTNKQSKIQKPKLTENSLEMICGICSANKLSNRIVFFVFF